MNEEAQLLTTGRVIAAARKIESKLVECGGSGDGMREKVESLGSRIPPETVQLINHIGGVRNRFAHESDAALRPDELKLFEEAVDAVLEDLDELASAPPPPPRPAGKKAVPKPSSVRIETEPAAESVTKMSRPDPTPTMWAALPGVHLVYAFLVGWNAFGRGQLYLLLLLAELLSLTALGFGIFLKSLPLTIAGGAPFLAVWLCGLLLGLLNRKEDNGLGLCTVPLFNLVWFLQKIIESTDSARLVVAGAIFGIWLAAIQLAVTGEYAAAAVIGLLSWGGALLDALLHRR